MRSSDLERNNSNSNSIKNWNKRTKLLTWNNGEAGAAETKQQ